MDSCADAVLLAAHVCMHWLMYVYVFGISGKVWEWEGEWMAADESVMCLTQSSERVVMGTSHGRLLLFTLTDSGE